MLRYAILGSGSSGNSYVFTDGQHSILIDQGYSVAELKRRLERFAIPLETVSAVFVTHLHPDHAKGTGTLARMQGKSIYLHSRAVEKEPVVFAKLGIPPTCLNTVLPYEMIEVGPFALFCFETSHDSQGSVGWSITYGDESAMILTDTGLYTEEHLQLAKDATLLFLEANYDEAMLKHGPYPYYLKARISGELGHLSNDQALHFLDESKFSGKHVYFVHLSDVNNNPDLLETAAGQTLRIPFTVCHKNQWYGKLLETQV